MEILRPSALKPVNWGTVMREERMGGGDEGRGREGV
jgi:hypothetical protein